MASKEDLEKMVKDLKEQVRELKSQIQEQVTEEANLTDVAFGVIRTEGKFKFVKLLFDFEKKKSQVGEIIDSSQALNNASFKGQKLIVDRILELIQIEDRNNRKKK